jgi:hypothetical protein
MPLTCPNPETITPLIGSGNYVFSLQKFPELTFFVQEAEIPSISLGVSIVASSVYDIPLPGETMEYADFSCTFIVDEKLSNYKAIHDWIVGLGFPENHQMYRDLLANSKNAVSLSELAKGFTDASLTILDNANRPVMQVQFADCFPIQLSGLQFSSSQSDASPVTCTATFTYSNYKLITATN